MEVDVDHSVCPEKVLTWLQKNRHALRIAEIERQAGLPQHSLHKHIHNHVPLPKHWHGWIANWYEKFVI